MRLPRYGTYLSEGTGTTYVLVRDTDLAALEAEVRTLRDRGELRKEAIQAERLYSTLLRVGMRHVLDLEPPHV